MAQNGNYAMGATRFIVNLSAIAKFTPFPFQSNLLFKILTGAGTLEITPVPIALSGASAAGWGLGYPIGASEVISVLGPVQMYFAASGATMTVSIAPAFSAGVTLPV